MPQVEDCCHSPGFEGQSDFFGSTKAWTCPPINDEFWFLDYPSRSRGFVCREVGVIPLEVGQSPRLHGRRRTCVFWGGKTRVTLAEVLELLISTQKLPSKSVSIVRY